MLPTVDDEPQARAAGRHAAKEIFRPMKWKRIGTRPDEDAKLYESAGQSRSSAATYCLRAVRPLQGSLAEAEAVLTSQTAALRKPGAPPLLARLLPASYASGGRVARYDALEHSTSEREHCEVQYARLRPYADGKNSSSNSSSSAQALEHHVLLAYTLTTRLQRSSARKSGQATTETSASVPSLLHLYRRVMAPSVARSRRDFDADTLSRDEFAITYILQEGAEPASLQLEVLITCSLETTPGREDARRAQRQRLRHDALCLTRLQPFLNARRLEQERAVLKQQQQLHFQRQQDSRRASAAVQPPQAQVSRHQQQQHSENVTTRHTVQLNGSGLVRGLPSANESRPSAAANTNASNCGICTRKFGPFRWKHHCEVCDKAICNHCLSVIANPALTRRKRRVCTVCLYGSTNGTHGGIPGARTAAQPAPIVSDPTGAAARNAAPRASTRLDRTIPNLDNLVLPNPPAPIIEVLPDESSRQSRVQSAPAQFATRTARSASGARRPPPPPPVPTLGGVAGMNRRGSRARKHQFSQGSIDDLHHQNQAHFHRVTLSGVSSVDKLYCSDDEFTSQRIRARRAQTVDVDGDIPVPILLRKKSFGMTPSYRESFSPLTRTESQQDLQHLQLLQHVNDGTNPKKLQFVQLRTPEPDYELDFNWYNIFPKAPIGGSAVSARREQERVRFLDNQLKIDTHSVVFLRDDRELEQLAHRVLDLATQWSGCSINYVAPREVFCLINASAEMNENEAAASLAADGSGRRRRPAVIVEDVISREESASSYAVHHRAPFFVPELEKDSRLRAHPLVTDNGAMSFLSFPICSSAAMSGGPYVIGTLDLWKLDSVAASSHVSQEWLESLDELLRAIGQRMEDLAKESLVFSRPRNRKAISVGSSCDSRSSTRRADSFELDLFDIDSESVVESPPLTDAETLDRLTRLSYSKVRGMSMMGGPNGPGSSWNYDSDNESTTSSQSYQSDSSRTSRTSRTSRSSRYSSHRYSAAELQSTIESLLHQVTETSKIISQTGVTV